MAQTSKTPKPINGVTKKPLLTFDFELVVPPYLHVCNLGPVNDMVKQINQVSELEAYQCALTPHKLPGLRN